MFENPTLGPAPFWVFLQQHICRDASTARRTLGIGVLIITIVLVLSSSSGRAFSSLTRNSGTTTTLSHVTAAPSLPGTISGKVIYQGTPKKYKPIEMMNEPNCAKLYPKPLMPEGSVTGPNNSLQNVVVYISEGAPDEKTTTGPIQLTQRGCRYAPHILVALRDQEVQVKNEDPVTHSVHLLAQANRESNRSQPPGTPPMEIRFSRPEFVPVKCDLHAWMRGVLVVLKNSHYAITDSNGAFALPDLPPGKYTVTAWHESYGTQSQEIAVSGGESKALNFTFKVAPY